MPRIGMEENLMSRVFILLGLNVQFSIKSHEVYKETWKYGPFRRKNKPTETIPEKINQQKLSLKNTTQIL